MGGGRIDRPVPSGTVTFLFTDIEGSTELLQDLGDDAYDVALSEHRRLLREAFASHGGHEMGTEGDSFFVAFEHATPAIAAAVSGQLALERHAWSHRPVRVRMGLHSGAAKVTDAGYVGLAVHQAARISAAAHGGQILVSHATHGLVATSLPDGAALTDLGEHRLKDLTEPVRIYNVTHPGLQAELPPPRTLSVLPNNLPIQLTSFIGRQGEVDTIGELLASNRLVTLTGVGGTGKTRLALQVGAESSTAFRHGVWFVELAPQTDPDLVLPEIARAMDLRADEERSIEDVLVQYVQGRQLLLLLDNCEHLAEASARACERLLQSSPELSIIATSREPLGARGEHVHRVPSLDVPSKDEDLDAVAGCDAVQLFCDRAERVSGTFTLNAVNAGAVTDICRRLDGLPLAIELAAARIRMFTPEELAQRLDRRFAILTGGSRTGLRRQQTLRATVDWSYDLLSEPEQRLFRRLSVFVGGFTLDAVDAICSGAGVDPDEVVDLLSSLVDRSLVGAEPQNARTRYRLLETMREYARELLAATDEAPDVWSRHLRWFADLAITGMDGLETADELEWAERLDNELDNFRQALAWSTNGGDPVDGVRIAGGLAQHWARGRNGAEALDQLRKTMAASAGLPLDVRALGLSTLSQLAMAFEGVEAGRPYAEECARLPREPAIMPCVAAAIVGLGYVASGRGDLGQATALVEEALGICKSIDYPYGEADTMNVLAQLMTWSGQTERMKELAQGSLAIYRRLGVPTKIIEAIDLLGIAAMQDGDLGEANRLANEVLVRSREINDRQHIAYALWGLATVSFEHGRYDRARALYDESLAILRERTLPQLIAECLRTIAAIDLRCGAYDRAAALLDEAEETWPYTGTAAASFDLTRAHLALARGDAAGIRRFAGRALTVFTDARALAVIPRAQVALAWSRALEGEHDAAHELAKDALLGARAYGGFAWTMNALRILSRIDFEATRVQDAERGLVEMLGMSSSKGFVFETGYALEMLGWVAAAFGRGERAAYLLGSAEQMRTTHGFVLLDVDLGHHDDAITATRSALGKEAFASAWERGRALTMDEAAAFGLQP